LFEITNLNKNGWAYFNLDSKDYTLFPDEKEVLIRTGCIFYILEISK